jgi:rod shape-determining protein MreD
VRLIKFLAALAAAALLHFLGTRLWPGFPRAVDLFLLVAALEARHGRPVAGMFAGLASGLCADALSGGPFGLFGFANTAIGYGTARAAQQLVVQRTTGLAALFAAGSAAQQAILALLALVFRDHVELPDPFWLPIHVASTALLGLAWTSASSALARRFRFWQRSRSSKLQLPG